jgi:hypothetical protein
MDKLVIAYAYYSRFGSIGGVGLLEHDFEGIPLANRERESRILAEKDAEEKGRLFRYSWIEKDESKIIRRPTIF